MDIRVGAVGRATSALSPSGYVEFDGVRHPARSEGSYVAAGVAVVVLRGDAFGMVVRELESGAATPAIGEGIGKAEHQLKAVDVAAMEREQQRQDGIELRQRMKRGTVIVAVVGIVVGLANAAIGLHFNWNNVNDAVGQSQLYGGSVLGCVIAGVVLHFATGWLAPQIFPYEERRFNADIVGIGMGLFGGLIGFWLRFGAEPETVAMWSVGLAIAFAGVGCGISWLLTLTAEL